tara:strand:- start:1734 stop:2768 length:1035 start_codon:yes stop_codon:yes gene_type:complete
MATKQNGVLGTFTPTVTGHTNLTRAANSTKVTTTGFPFYTCPGATLMSGKLIIANNTGGSLNVDVGIVEATDIVQFDSLGSQPNDPNTSASYLNYGAFSFPTNQQTSSIVIEGAAGSGNFSPGETVTWTNTNRGSGAAANMSAKVYFWDSTNKKLWLYNMTHPLALDLPAGDTTFTGGTTGATLAAGTSHAGTGANNGWSGLARSYDSLNGTLYLQNYEFRNNLDYKLIGDINTEVREVSNNNINRSLSRIWRPVETTVTRYAAAGNTTPTTEFVDANGVELLVSGVTKIAAEQYIVKQKAVADASVFEVTGLVLGSYQSLFVSCSGAVSCTLIGFEEAAEIAS